MSEPTTKTASAPTNVAGLRSAAGGCLESPAWLLCELCAGMRTGYHRAAWTPPLLSARAQREASRVLTRTPLQASRAAREAAEPRARKGALRARQARTCGRLACKLAKGRRFRPVIAHMGAHAVPPAPLPQSSLRRGRGQRAAGARAPRPRRQQESCAGKSICGRAFRPHPDAGKKWGADTFRRVSASPSRLHASLL